jgi:hypothetical protein
MKQFAKICLNSLWGKFGQRTALDTYDFITDFNKMLLHLSNDKVKTTEWHIINENCVEIRFNEDINYDIEPETGSEITAVFTTANARIRLLSMLTWLHESQRIYCDTDSVIFLYDENNPEHKKPDNNAIDLPINVKFGDALGDWQDEFNPGEWIDEIVACGAKSYSFKTNKGNIVIKQKGITLDKANTNIFTFESVKSIVLEQKVLESAKRFQFRTREKTKQIETVYIARTVKQTVDSKRTVLSDHTTVPFGYEF